MADLNAGSQVMWQCSMHGWLLFTTWDRSYPDSVTQPIVEAHQGLNPMLTVLSSN